MCSRNYGPSLAALGRPGALQPWKHSAYRTSTAHACVLCLSLFRGPQFAPYNQDATAMAVHPVAKSETGCLAEQNAPCFQADANPVTIKSCSGSEGQPLVRQCQEHLQRIAPHTLQPFQHRIAGHVLPATVIAAACAALCSLQHLLLQRSHALHEAARAHPLLRCLRSLACLFAGGERSAALCTNALRVTQPLTVVLKSPLQQRTPG